MTAVNKILPVRMYDTKFNVCVEYDPVKHGDDYDQAEKAMDKELKEMVKSIREKTK